MSHTLIASPIIRAQELMKAPIGSFTIEELIAHREALTSILLELSNQRAFTPGQSINAVAHIMHIESKLLAHLRLLQEMIEDLLSLRACQQASNPAAGETEAKAAKQPSRRWRVATQKKD